MVWISGSSPRAFLVLLWLVYSLTLVLATDHSIDIATDYDKLTSGTEGDLVSALLSRSPHDSGIFDDARRVLERLALSPTCGRLPTARLLATCKEVKESNREYNAGQLLENSKSIYAVRMAMCETIEGKAPVPQPCNAIQQTYGSVVDFEFIHSMQIQSCLEVMQEHHYYWTSYSNNRQDASVLCDASRIDNLRDDFIDTMKQLSEVMPGFVQKFHEEQEYAWKWMSHFSSNVDQMDYKMTQVSKELTDSVAQSAILTTNLRESLSIARFLGQGLESISDRFISIENGIAGIYVSATDSLISAVNDAVANIGLACQNTVKSLDAQLYASFATTSNQYEELQEDINAAHVLLARSKEIQIEQNRLGIEQLSMAKLTLESQEKSSMFASEALSILEHANSYCKPIHDTLFGTRAILLNKRHAFLFACSFPLALSLQSRMQLPFIITFTICALWLSALSALSSAASNYLSEIFEESDTPERLRLHLNSAIPSLVAGATSLGHKTTTFAHASRYVVGAVAATAMLGILITQIMRYYERARGEKRRDEFREKVLDELEKGKGMRLGWGSARAWSRSQGHYSWSDDGTEHDDRCDDSDCEVDWDEYGLKAIDLERELNAFSDSDRATVIGTENFECYYR